MSLTKKQIIGAVSCHTGFTQKKSRESVNTLIEIIKSTLESGDHIAIRHFGKFEIKEKKSRRWRNPSSGNEMVLPPRRVVTFKSFKRLKDRLNAEPDPPYLYRRPHTEKNATQTGVISPDRLNVILSSHKCWLESGGKKGEKAILIRAKLKGSDLYGLRLSQVDFKEADLRGADLSETDLYEANFQEANLIGAILEWASLDGANLKWADLQGADLRWANLEGTNLSGANLRFADFEGANLKGAKLCEADLYGTNLRNTDMQGIILNKIKLDYETQLNLPKPVFEKYRQTFQVLEWSPALAPT